jgi:hypothetical protein
MMPSPQDLAKASLSLANQLLANLLYRYPEHSVDGAAAVARANVHSVGVGEKITKGQPTGQMSLRLHVVQKLPPSLIPTGFELPKEYRGIPTDIIESPPVFIQPGRALPVAPTPQPSCTSNRDLRQRPVIAGISFSSERVTGGTLACFCQSTRAGEENSKYALSTGHVMGSIFGGGPGDAVLQPAPGDVGMTQDRIGTVHRIVPIQRGRQASNTVDAGIALLDPAIAIDNQVCTIGALAGLGTARSGLPVIKHGRSTGLTKGVVTETSCHVLVTLRHADLTLVARFTDQIRIDTAEPRTFSEGADSGSLIVDPATNRAIGLLFAGPDSGIFAYANPIEAVFKSLDIAMF